VLGWCALELLAESIGAEHPERVALDLFDRLRLREPFAQAFNALGFEGEEGWRVAARIKIGLLTAAGAGKPNAKPDKAAQSAEAVELDKAAESVDAAKPDKTAEFVEAGKPAGREAESTALPRVTYGAERRRRLQARRLWPIPRTAASRLRLRRSCGPPCGLTRMSAGWPGCIRPKAASIWCASATRNCCGVC